MALMSLPYFSWDEGEDYHSEISSQVIGGAPSAVSESTGPIFEEASDGEGKRVRIDEAWVDT